MKTAELGVAPEPRLRVEFTNCAKATLPTMTSTQMVLPLATMDDKGGLREDWGGVDEDRGEMNEVRVELPNCAKATLPAMTSTHMVRPPNP